MNKCHPVLAAIFLSAAPELWASTNAFDTVTGHNGAECGFYLDHSPTARWDGIGVPPLTVERVSAIFDRWAQNQYGDDTTSHILSYKLWSVIPKSHQENSWVYKIEYLNLESNAPPNLISRYIVIAMDEKMIESTCNAL